MNVDLSALKGKRVLCAVSGGADSMCLLHLLYEAGISVVAAHYEHGIRGEESLRDMEFVCRCCEAKGIRCVVGHGDVPDYAREHGLGIEAAARELRYAFLNKAADEYACDRIATAHNADDNAETLLLALCRGAGAAGLSGIPVRRGRIVRPLLGVTRAEIERYLSENAIPHVEDSTNADDEYSRNLIRHQVMPVLRRINPDCVSAMQRAAALIGRDGDHLEAEAAAFIASYYDGESIPCDRLNALHRAVSSRVVRRLTDQTVGMEQTDRLLELARSHELQYADIAGQRVCVEQGRMYLRSAETVRIPPRELVIGGRTEIPEVGLIVAAELTEHNGEVNDLFNTFYCKYEKLYGKVLLTGRQDGDRLRPIGRGCTKSLKSLFTEAHYTQRQRDATLVLRDEEGILAVYGLAADERIRCSPGDRALRISIETTKI